MTSRAALAVAAAALAGGCTLVTHFDASRTVESNDRLCADGVDNDGDGLADCQDWDCLDKKPCCTLDALVFEDSFGALACAAAPCSSPDPSCRAIDPSRWQSWGVPLPEVCEGALHPYKAEQCYDVGLLATTPLGMHPGVNVTVHVVGQPEPAGRLVVGLTQQSTILGGDTACEALQPVDTFAEARLLRSPSGVRVEASFDGAAIGSSAELDAAATHEIKLSIGADLTLAFVVDGTTIAQSEALPKMEVTAHLALFGRGLAAGFTDVRVTDGTQCESPGAWQPAPVVAALGGVGDNGNSWDSFQVFAPAVVDDAQLLYSGCGLGTSSNECSSPTGLGSALVGSDGALQRDPANPILFDVSRKNFDSTVLREESAPPERRGYVTAQDGNSNFKSFIQTFTFAGLHAPVTLGEGEHALALGGAGSWDEAAICCATAVRRQDTVLLWYAGQARGDPTWRIGLASSADGITFQRFGAAPVVSEGGHDDFDSRGVSDPEVIWDATRGLYRMWYTAMGALNTTSIGYAVSTDGVNWHKYPGNPVITRDTAGLDALGSPAVLRDDNGLRLWLQGSVSEHVGLGIFALENHGVPSGKP